MKIDVFARYLNFAVETEEKSHFKMERMNKKKSSLSLCCCCEERERDAKRNKLVVEMCVSFRVYITHRTHEEHDSSCVQRSLALAFGEWFCIVAVVVVRVFFLRSFRVRSCVLL